MNSDLISDVSQLDKSMEKVVDEVEQVTDPKRNNNDSNKNKQEACTEKASEAEKCKQMSKSSGKHLSMETRSASMASDTSEREIPSSTPRSDPGSPIQDSYLIAEQASQLTQNVVDIMTQSIYLPSEENNFDSIEETTQLLTDRSTFSVVEDEDLTVVESREQESEGVSMTSKDSLNTESMELKNEVSIQNIVKTEAKTISEKSSSDVTSSSATVKVSTSSESKVHTNIIASDTVSEHKLFSSESVSTISTKSIHSVESKSEILKTSSIETKISTSLQSGEGITVNEIQKPLEGNKTQTEEEEKRKNDKSAFENGRSDGSDKSPIESEDKYLSDKETAKDNMESSSEQKKPTIVKEKMDDEVINSKEDLDEHKIEYGDQIKNSSCDTKDAKDSEILPGNESYATLSKSQIENESKKQEQDPKNSVQTDKDVDNSEVQKEVEETAKAHVNTENNQDSVCGTILSQKTDLKIDEKRDSIASATVSPDLIEAHVEQKRDSTSSQEPVEVESKDDEHGKILSEDVNQFDPQLQTKKDSNCNQKSTTELAEKVSEPDWSSTEEYTKRTSITSITTEIAESMQQSEAIRSSISSKKSSNEAEGAKEIDSTEKIFESDIVDQKVVEIEASVTSVEDHKRASISCVKSITEEEQQKKVSEIKSLTSDENGEELSQDPKTASIATASIKSETESSEAFTCLEQKRASVGSIKSVTGASETLYASEQKRASVASISSMSETSEQITVEQKRASISSLKSASETFEISNSLKRDSISSIKSATENLEGDSLQEAKSIKTVYEKPDFTEENPEQRAEVVEDLESVREEAVDIKSKQHSYEKKDIEKEKDGDKTKDDKETKAADGGSSEISGSKESEEDPIAGWGKPLGLPSPIRPGTPSKHSRKTEEDSAETKVT